MKLLLILRVKVRYHPINPNFLPHYDTYLGIAWISRYYAMLHRPLHEQKIMNGQVSRLRPPPSLPKSAIDPVENLS